MLPDNYLAHHGILGQKWGVRRFQNENGSLTDVGRKRYSKNDKKKTKKEMRFEKAKEQKRKAAEVYAKDPFLREHIKWDNDGNIIKISKDLEKALDAPLSDIDDEDLVIMVAQELAEQKSISHHGILGQKWGVRRYQNEDGSLTAKGKKHYAKADTKWAKKNTDKITRKTQNKVKKELTAFNKELSKQPGYLNKDGSVSKAAINEYNRKMASLMNTAVGDITSPSGRVVRFVAKRSEVGVQMALADRGYDISQLKNGVWSGGRVAYRSQQLNKIDI